MKNLTEADLRAWVDAVTCLPPTSEQLLPWIEGPLRTFFPYKGLVLGHGDLVAGQLKVTHMLASGHDEAYLNQIATTFELEQRGTLKWWFANRQPFYIDPAAPPPYASAFELEEIRRFGLGNVAGHGVLNIRSNAGTYFGFAGVGEPLSEWHLDALRLIAPVLNDLLLAHLADGQKRLPEPLHSLTPRQKVIVRHLATGMSNKVIARTLGISDITVRNQLGEIYARVGVNRRAQLIALLK
jgi:DNA-binding CsgD family transcriptional regulator